MRSPYSEKHEATSLMLLIAYCTLRSKYSMQYDLFTKLEVGISSKFPMHKFLQLAVYCIAEIIE